jgi:hypothetical protein
MTRLVLLALLRDTLAPVVILSVLLSATTTSLAAPNYPITEQQRDTAQKVAEAGVPLSELSPDAPSSYTVKRGDTLWGISEIFLKRPWRWPELWGMNLQEIRNPHLIFSGQTVYLDTSNGRARLRVGQSVDGGVLKLSPRVRRSALDDSAIPSIPFNLIEPFLANAVIFEGNALESAPRIVAAQEGRVLLTRGDTAYVRGDYGKDTVFRLFRQAKPLKDPMTSEVLGYEAAYIGTAELVKQGETRVSDAGLTEVVPDSFIVTSIRQEAGVGDRLAPAASQQFENYAPRAPAAPLAGQIVSVYGDALSAGQNQIVALNRGATNGLERGHVLALWQGGRPDVDKTGTDGVPRTAMRLPDERHGMLFVFRVFDRMSYALILSVKEPVRAGDKFTQP